MECLAIGEGSCFSPGADEASDPEFELFESEPTQVKKLQRKKQSKNQADIRQAFAQEADT
jgi:hypothetical protein